MPHFNPVAVINHINENDFVKLQEKYGICVDLHAKWSWNGEIIPVENFEDINKLNNDEGFAEKMLMNSNVRM